MGIYQRGKVYWARWIENGQQRVRVFDVAGELRDDQRVDLETCQPQGAGADTLCTVWTDPEFDPKVSASYYARVLEIPTPRWTAYEAKRFGIKMKKEIPMVTVERACTSPIWYDTAGK